MQLWLIYALLGAISASMVSIFTKLGVVHLSPSLAGTIKGIIMALFLVAISSIKGDFNNISSIFEYKKDFIFLILTGVFGALSWLFMNYAFKYGSVTKVVPIDKLSIVFTILLSALILNEKLNFKILIGVALVFIGALVIAFN